MIRLFKAENTISVVIAIMLFSMLYLTYSHWQTQQNDQTNFVFQQRQALQIAENQIALKMNDKQACESSIEQNGIYFEIQCSSQQIRVSFPKGEVIIKRDD
ncbi:DUF5374 domain-containing protein [Glaesserella sp.]|uniref:DUF5374 domain-containing protein n=1 Tax=Glaesserella sp. TaxID=2094731 RepID=UPI0035A104F1